MIVLSSHEAVKGVFLPVDRLYMAMYQCRPLILTEPPKTFLIADRLYTGN
jgi:hypothetical protein